MTTTEDRPAPAPPATTTPRRGGPTPWAVWLGTLALGGSMTHDEVAATLAGSRPGSAAEQYLIAQAQNP